MKFLYLVINWIFGLFFLVMGLITTAESPLAGLSLVLLSFLLIPAVRNFTYSKFNLQIPVKIRGILLFVLFVAYAVFLSQSHDNEALEIARKQAKENAERTAQLEQENIAYFLANKEKILLTANTALIAKEFQSVISQTNKYLASGDKELKTINTTAKIEIDKIRKSEKTKQLLALLEKVPSSEIERNKELYEQLLKLHPNNESYKNKAASYTKLINKKKQEKLAAEARKKQIEEQFSAWDGSHRNLERVIKKAMNDPNSYEHDETVYWDQGDYLIVKTTYRGTNAFGGVVKNFVKAKVSLDGQVLEILDQT